jgi:hypothetical protein
MAFRTITWPLLARLFCLTISFLPAVQAEEPKLKALRAGIIGLDTSHVPAFTKIFNGNFE